MKRKRTNDGVTGDRAARGRSRAACSRVVSRVGSLDPDTCPNKKYKPQSKDSHLRITLPRHRIHLLNNSIIHKILMHLSIFERIKIGVLVNKLWNLIIENDLFYLSNYFVWHYKITNESGPYYGDERHLSLPCYIIDGKKFDVVVTVESMTFIDKKLLEHKDAFQTLFDELNKDVKSPVKWKMPVNVNPNELGVKAPLPILLLFDYRFIDLCMKLKLGITLIIPHRSAQFHEVFIVDKKLISRHNRALEYGLLTRHMVLSEFVKNKIEARNKRFRTWAADQYFCYKFITQLELLRFMQ